MIPGNFTEGAKHDVFAPLEGLPNMVLAPHFDLLIFKNLSVPGKTCLLMTYTQDVFPEGKYGWLLLLRVLCLLIFIGPESDHCTR